ncbi:hypothetical protein C8F04DRAFT_1265284 [Mycena alexandri]|uniref:C2H2-type domain-containing protein n=1 Tax=Mycena alexandri TaxID=1745969 RepID=A0AAD6SNS0_9AGAR|nr:hypothetical protein C8F04DRAFT_1265284 [Mycena alexandri]
MSASSLHLVPSFNLLDMAFSITERPARHLLFQCGDCHKYCRDNAELDAHNAAIHAVFKCTICKGRTFLAQSSLDEHYRGKLATIHPNCNHCGKGFSAQRTLDDHVVTAHSRTKCCDLSIHNDDLLAHYFESLNHPMCDPCGIGFKDDDAYITHVAAAHADLHCVPCRRRFRTCEALNEHLKTDVHPQCAQCNMGFFDADGLNEHNAAPAHILRMAFRLSLEGLLPAEGAPPVNTWPPPPPRTGLRNLWAPTTSLRETTPPSSTSSPQSRPASLAELSDSSSTSSFGWVSDSDSYRTIRSAGGSAIGYMRCPRTCGL